MQVPEYIGIQKAIVENIYRECPVRLPSLRELASRYNVSLDTIHKALKSLEKDDFITAGKRCYTVNSEVLKKPGLKDNFISELFSSVRNMDIKDCRIFLTSSLNAYYFELIDLLTSKLMKANINSLIQRIPLYIPEDIENEYKKVRKDLSGNDILIFLPGLPEQCHVIMNDCRRRKIKIIAFGDCATSGVNSVIIDSFNGSYNALKFLSGLGRRRTAYASGIPPTNNSGNYRYTHYRAYKEAVEAGIIEADDKLIFPANFERIKNGMITYARLAVDYFLSLKKIPEAIFFGDDVAAAAAVNFIRRKGYRVPEDISITGINGSVAAELSDLEIATVVYSKEKIAEAFLELVMSKSNWEEGSSIVIKSEFRKGNSCVRKEMGK